MDIKHELKGPVSIVRARKIASWIGNDATRFDQLVDLFLAGPYRTTQMAALPLTYCAETHPDLIFPRFNAILDHIQKPGTHDAVKRNFIRLLQFIDIPRRHWGKVTQICWEFLTDKREPVAVRVFSMTVLARIASHEPDLNRELKIVIENNLPGASPAFQSRARKVLEAMKVNMDI